MHTLNHLIPYPSFGVDYQSGVLPLDDLDTIAVSDSQFVFAANQVSAFLESQTHAAHPIVPTVEKSCFVFETSQTLLDEEGYQLTITPQRCTIESSTSKGAFYAVQTLKQLYCDKTKSFPCCHIQDAPSLSWRGFLLDSTRSFCPVEDVYRILDLMACLKLNVLHWHISDDQGWRIALDSYPHLIDSSTSYYTKQEVQELIAYGIERNITIIPEIDMPGHFVAALYAYPQFSCTGGPFTVPHEAGIFLDVLCVGKDEALQFAKQVVEEICDLFPSSYIHLGGDEIPLVRWKSCPDCQKRMRDLHLPDERSLLRWFSNEMVKVAKAKEKQVILWDDFLNDQYDSSIITQIWNPLIETNQINPSDNARCIIKSDYFHTYLDMDHSMVSTKTVYQYGSAIQKDKKRGGPILGSEFLLWTEHIHTREERDSHLFPRLAAGAESLWTREELLDYKRFTKSFSKAYKKILMHPVTIAHRYAWDPPRLYQVIRNHLQKRRVHRNSIEAGITL